MMKLLKFRYLVDIMQKFHVQIRLGANDEEEEPNEKDSHCYEEQTEDT